MSVAAAVRAGRLAAARLQIDSCTITRSTTAGRVLNQQTRRYETAEPAQLYAGPCRVKNYRQNNDRVVQAGETATSLWPFIVAVPATVDGLEVDDIVTITASPLDPGSIGLRLRIRDVLYGSEITARRLGCEVDAG